jgi:hypothetical protein
MIGVRRLALAILLVAGCGGGTEARPCPGALRGEPERRPPARLALPAGAHVYASEGPFGKTERFYAAVDGTDLIAGRDRAAAALTDAGYTLLREDQEPPVEAEAHFEGVSVQVATLCDGKLRLRYTVS